MRSLVYLPAESLKITVWPTKTMSDDEFQELKTSIAKNGILVPILVMDSSVFGESSYEVLEGRHRLKAAIELGITTIPCILFDPISETEEVVSAIYDTEVFRKTYTEEEKKALLLQKEKNEKDFMDKVVSHCANSTLSTDELQNLTGHNRINSKTKMIKLISVIDTRNAQRIAELQKELELLKQELSQREEQEKDLKKKLSEAQHTIQNIESLYKEQFETKLKERVQAELEKEISRREQLKQDTTKETIERIKAEIEQELRKKLKEEYEEKIREKEQDIIELNQNLAEISRKLKELKEVNEKYDRELARLKEENKSLSINYTVSDNVIKRMKQTIEKISTSQNFIRQVDNLAKSVDNLYEFAIAASEVGFSKVELKNAELALINLRNKVDKVYSFINQVTPWDADLPEAV